MSGTIDSIDTIGKHSIGERNPSTVGAGVPRLATRGERPLRVLSEDDWRHWEDNGYVVVRDAVPRAVVERIEALVWEFEEMDPADPRTWYPPDKVALRRTELSYNAGMVELYHHQLLWDARQSPRVHGAFADIWGTPELWVSIDRVNLNLPPEPGFAFKGFMHYDYDPDGAADSVQGVLSIGDQLDPELGGFCCIPQLFRDYPAWRARQPADWDWYRPDVAGLPIERVPLAKGDLLIFNSRLCHGIRQNVSRDRARIAQYIAMLPAREDDAAAREWRVRCWRERLAPQGYSLHGDARGVERTRYDTAQLTPLGERLLGLTSWREQF
ncbi:phytanoyl-CoA dioxygenase family protein [Pseudoduganella chitinolytica]|uniref:Phytanoyl-CoA dioxygenase family protein n=1 Tax=Pseudoduganella chitinolytica TaxID=34070 RepID=A0ABY8BJD0_9BURK|nr:phytanoyl-CoA dioxygenase family protein [Pseudoduganella chitinolytica]WEF34359.1 phytanoyl-CoA dioxygenase family protein [Pseudoduganella chitinolytica]